MKPVKMYCLVFTFALCSCKSSSGGVRTIWKYEHGAHFGDVLFFTGETIDIKGDTVFDASVPFAIVHEWKPAFFGFTENKLILKDLRTGAFGFYTDKGK